MARETGSRTKARKVPAFRGIRPVGKPRPVSEAVYESMKEAILKGDLTPGLRLVEHHLSLQMNTSRIPVREALKRLEQEGLVEKPDLRGFVVKRLTRDEIRETFGIRAVLESYAAALATENMTEAVLEKLETNVHSYREALQQRDNTRMMQLNTQFDDLIRRASGSERLSSLISLFRDFIHRYRQHLLNRLDYAAVSLNHHEKIVAAMKQGDVERVEQLVRQHILRGRDIALGDDGDEGETHRVGGVTERRQRPGGKR